MSLATQLSADNIPLGLLPMLHLAVCSARLDTLLSVLHSSRSSTDDVPLRLADDVPLRLGAGGPLGSDAPVSMLCSTC
jgi:hypothetical protein